ncbi:LANO_0G01244g1_1 [Lachancea nothofagi CBS 11611]|uniref:LANO_0G01244g1_1 n=1 Tax=Lachancea nothofagi CBS 11611 TaxID=1266666 RepID=A0A1G4KEJ9_9SACH|nr:LANO_0G01244g1_1 [Lachancea nothofagi CBS 11611]
MTARVDSMKNGFLVIPFKLNPSDKVKNGLKDSSDRTDSTEADLVAHYMFMKKHLSKNNEEQNCLFLANLPLLTHAENLKKALAEILEQHGAVAHVSQLLHHDEFGLNDIDLSSLTSDLMSTGSAEEKRFTPRNTALLQFVDSASLENAWSALRKYSQEREKAKLVNWSFESPSMETFTNFYKPLDLDYLKEDIYSHMTLFEQREQQAQEETQSSIVDEDGFTLVVGKNTKSLNSIRKKILNKNPLLKHEKIVKPPTMVDKKAKQDFYRFQLREQKKQEISELLKKFKQDQETIKEMKSKRRFNPYS